MRMIIRRDSSSGNRLISLAGAIPRQVSAGSIYLNNRFLDRITLPQSVSKQNIYYIIGSLIRRGGHGVEQGTQVEMRGRYVQR